MPLPLTSGSRLQALSRGWSGRVGALLIAVSGAASFFSLLRPDARGENPVGVLMIGLLAIVTGVVSWSLPWQRWSRRASLVLLPIGLALAAGRNILGGDDPFLYPIFFIAAYAWLGIAHERWMSLKSLPLFVVAYLLPLHWVSPGATALTSVFYVGMVCVIVAELLAWAVEHWRQSRTALTVTRSAVIDIGEKLAEIGDPVEKWRVVATELTRLLDATRTGIYRWEQGADPICVAAALVGGGDDEARLGRRREPGNIDRLAAATRQPVVVMSVADERLSDAERESLLASGDTAFLIVPLIIRAQVVGLVEVCTKGRQAEFDADRVASAVSICRLIALSIHSTEIIERQDDHLRKLRQLVETCQAVARVDGLDAALRIVTRSAGDIMDVGGCAAYEYDEDEGLLVPRGMWQREQGVYAKFGSPLRAVDNPSAFTALANGRPLLEVISDASLDLATRETMLRQDQLLRLTLPMQSCEGPTGLLVLWDNTAERTFSADEMILAGALGDLGGEAVRADRLLREARRAGEADVLSGLAGQRRIGEDLTWMLAQAERDDRVVSVLLVAVGGFRLTSDQHGRQADDDVIKLVARALRDSTRASDRIGRYAADRFLVVLPQTTRSETQVVADHVRRALGEQAWVSATGERIAVRVGFGSAEYPNEAATASDLIAAAEARLDEVRPRADIAPAAVAEGSGQPTVYEERYGMLETLITAIDRRDGLTRRHSEQVTTYALAIARTLELSPEQLRIVRLAGLLHDVGKIAVPDAILNKREPLTGDEAEVLRDHVLVGAAIVAALRDADELEAAILAHHERWDGSGYPHGLSGAGIPLMARIVAIADAYATLTSDRPGDGEE